MRRAVVLALVSSACTSSATLDSGAGRDAGAAFDAGSVPASDAGQKDGAPGPDSGPDAGPAPDSLDAATSTSSNIRHVVVVVQENHTFDAYFGRYCTAPAGSNPSCTTGPSCCEAAPATEPSGSPPVDLDDIENGSYDPNHSQLCELGEIDHGAMDHFASGTGCSSRHNFAIATASAAARYHALASRSALADRYFQPIAGATSSNDMYLAVAQYVFTDNTVIPRVKGWMCIGGGTAMIYDRSTTVADLLIAAGFSYAHYIEGYAAMLAAATCPAPPADCPAQHSGYPCTYDPSDIPFQYFGQFADNPTHMKDYSALAGDIAAGALPSLAFVKALGYRTEHPGEGTSIRAGEEFVADVAQAIAASPHARDTLLLVTWDEGGGYFDHIAPPPDSTVDQQPYGTRVPLLAIGRFARPNAISHVTLEHSSIVKFVEYNFLHQTGQLFGRDQVVHNLGSLLDPAETGLAIPED
jgi:phospholipase C